MNTEAYADEGESDVLKTDSLPKAREMARNWARKSGKPVSINEISTKTLETYSDKAYSVEALDSEGKFDRILLDGDSPLMTWVRAKQVMADHKGPEQCHIAKRRDIIEA